MEGVKWRRRRLAKAERNGQTMVEFALLAPLMVLFIFVGLTFAVIGETQLAVSQLAYSAARYAAVNPTLSASSIETYITSGQLGSPTITANNGALLTVNVQQATAFGDPVTVSISYDLSSNALIGGMTTLFAGLGMPQTLPTTVSATETTMSE